MTTSIKKSVFLLPVLGILLGGVLAYLMDPAGEGAKLALRMLVSVFSITGGVVLGTIVLLGDPASLVPGSARLAYWQSKTLQGQLTGLSLLFASYIIALLSIVLSSILSDVSCLAAVYLTRFSVGIGTAALVWSLRMPFLFLSIQKGRLQKEIDRRRAIDRQDTGKLQTV